MPRKAPLSVTEVLAVLWGQEAECEIIPVQAHLPSKPEGRTEFIRQAARGSLGKPGNSLGTQGQLQGRTAHLQHGQVPRSQPCPAALGMPWHSPAGTAGAQQGPSAPHSPWPVPQKAGEVWSSSFPLLTSQSSLFGSISDKLHKFLRKITHCFAC